MRKKEKKGLRCAVGLLKSYPMTANLLTTGADAKTKKGEKLNVKTGILYLAPFTEASQQLGRKINLCPHASAGCSAACLFTAGRGRMKNVYQARVNKTLRFMKERGQFLIDLRQSIRKFELKFSKKGFKCAVRLNGTSDLPWEKLINFSSFPTVQFYDYTKNPQRAIENAQGKHPANYHLTFSLSESNDEDAKRVLKAGCNVAVVFSPRKTENGLPKTFWRRKVIDGDISDVRFLDPKGGKIVGLKAKGKAKTDTSGFVR